MVPVSSPEGLSTCYRLPAFFLHGLDTFFSLFSQSGSDWASVWVARPTHVITLPNHLCSGDGVFLNTALCCWESTSPGNRALALEGIPARLEATGHAVPPVVQPTMDLLHGRHMGTTNREGISYRIPRYTSSTHPSLTFRLLSGRGSGGEQSSHEPTRERRHYPCSSSSQVIPEQYFPGREKGQRVQAGHQTAVLPLLGGIPPFQNGGISPSNQTSCCPTG